MKLKQKVAPCGSQMKNKGGLWVRGIKEPTFYQKMWGLWVTEETISKNMGSLGDNTAENRGSFEPYIRVTSIMGAPLATSLQSSLNLYTLNMNYPGLATQA